MSNCSAVTYARHYRDIWFDSPTLALQSLKYLEYKVTALYALYALPYAALHCTTMHCTALYALHCAALYFSALHCTALHYAVLHGTATYSSVLYSSALSTIKAYNGYQPRHRVLWINTAANLTFLVITLENAGIRIRGEDSNPSAVKLGKSSVR